MKIGILQTGHVATELAQEHGEYSDMFQRFLAGHGFAFQVWNVVDDEFPEAPDIAGGWLITGSRFSVNDDFPWIRRLEEFLRRCYAETVPIVGICFGHQILASALGGKVEQASQGWGVGRHRYETPEGPLNLNAWHQDQVIVPPAGAEIIGSSRFCRYAMLSYGPHGLSFQPHPEFDAGFLSGLIEVRGVGLVPAERLSRARDDLGKDTDSERVADRIASFFHTAGQKNCE
ncbi:MAG: type 1 glutamine amidotransferase [Rhodobacteraceae bacterium]|nr:type 1 glutamine amidotransferase [Paracoccaceae bacterium]